MLQHLGYQNMCHLFESVTNFPLWVHRLSDSWAKRELRQNCGQPLHMTVKLLGFGLHILWFQHHPLYKDFQCKGRSLLFHYLCPRALANYKTYVTGFHQEFCLTLVILLSKVKWTLRVLLRTAWPHWLYFAATLYFYLLHWLCLWDLQNHDKLLDFAYRI